MQDDRDQTFASIDTYPDGTRGRLSNHIERSQSHIISRTKSRKWIERLKVLIPAATSSTADHTLDYDYKLIPQSELSDKRYIAISYCWRSSGRITDLELVRPVRILQNGVVREARARPEALRRAFRYALSIGVESIWIDQECIEQDDRVDKENGIQSMDLVYRRAYRALGLLEACNVEDEDDVKTLLEIQADSTGQNSSFDQYSRVDSPLLVKLINDPWFTRAWVNQEYLCAENIVLVVAWDIALASKKWEEFRLFSVEMGSKIKSTVRYNPAQQTFAEWTISEWMFAKLAAWMVFAMDHNDGEIMPPVLTKTTTPLVMGIVGQEGARSDVVLRRADSLTAAFEAMNMKHATPSTISFNIHANYVCKALDEKQNSRVADRLAMVSNITDYKWGLDINAVHEIGLSFTACALGLSLFNGDASLIMRDESNFESPSNGWLPTWDSNLHDLTLAVDFTPGPLHPALVINSELVAEGCLWTVEPYNALSDLHPDVQRNMSKIDELQLTQPLYSKAVAKLLETNLRLIIDRLALLGHWNLIESLIPLGHGFLEATQLREAMDQVRAYFNGSSDFFPELDDMRGGSRIQWICEQIAEQKPLLVGKQVDQSNHAEPVCILSSLPDPAPPYLFVIADQFRNFRAGSGFCWTVECLETEAGQEMIQNAHQRLADYLYVDTRQMSISKKRLQPTGSIRCIWSPWHIADGELFIIYQSLYNGTNSA